jgi:hypothetical protein
MNRVFVVIFLLCLAVPASALEIGGVQLPDHVSVQGRQLQLNGAGLRTKLFFKIYAGGLYLTAPDHDAAAIIAADELMQVRMHFIYDGVSVKKMQNGWREGFAITAPGASEDLQAAMEAFIDFFNEEVEKNDIYDIVWLPGKGTEVMLNGNSLGLITGLDLKKALFAIWLGSDPVDDDLKEGMLGR